MFIAFFAVASAIPLEKNKGDLGDMEGSPSLHLLFQKAHHHPVAKAAYHHPMPVKAVHHSMPKAHHPVKAVKALPMKAHAHAPKAHAPKAPKGHHY